MTNTWDIYLPHAVGLSDVFHRLDSMTQHDKNYPPYNLIKYDTSNKMDYTNRHSKSLLSILYQKNTGPTSGPVPIFILSAIVCLTFFVQSHIQFSSGVLG